MSDPTAPTVDSVRAPIAWRHWLAALVLAGFVLLMYGRLLFGDRVLATGDILLYFYPYRDYAASALTTATLPLWNPYLFAGAPFLANPQAAVLYQLHWPLAWLPVTKQIYWSAAIHTWLFGFGGYWLMWQSTRKAPAALITALVLAGSGLYGGLVGHINQMNAAAWLPWALVIITAPRPGMAEPHLRRSLGLLLWDIGCFALVVALMLLAGHTQTAYDALCGVVLVAVLLAVLGRRKIPAYNQGSERRWLRTVAGLYWAPIGVVVLGALLGALLAAAQLLPTIELSGLGLRSGGLSYQEVTSFSLKPLQLLWTLLPSYGLADLGVVFDTLGYTEYVAYVGLVGLVLAVIGIWRSRDKLWLQGILLAGGGLFLAAGRWNPAYYLLYRLVPGFDLFRVPARWLLLYTVGMAILAGVGAELIDRRPHAQRRLLWSVLCLLVIGELLLAARALPYTHPTAPEAVDDVRTAPAHLLTDPVRGQLHPAAAGRFLSMSTIAYDPGDMADYRSALLQSPGQLDASAFSDLVIAQKAQEILAPNLSLLWRAPALDGFDGGVLPLMRYNQLALLLTSSDKLVSDGRLREQMTEVPTAQLLGALNVQHLITDKVRDLWFDGVYYDRQIGALLQPNAPAVTVDIPQPFAATHIDLIAYVDLAPEATAQVELTATAVAEVSVRVDGVLVEQMTLSAGGAPGAHLADGALHSPLALSSGAVVAFEDVQGARQEYRVRLPLSRPLTPDAIDIRQRSGAPNLMIRAMTLYDERTGMFLALLPSDRGRFRLVHSGDVKVYENLDVRPRAYLVHNTLEAGNVQQARELLASGTNLADAAIVEQMPALHATASAGDQAQLLSYSPESVKVQTVSQEESLLVLSDAFYPGWLAAIDGQAAPIHATNVLFRGVRVPAGEHIVTFDYAPQSWRVGLWLTGAGIVLIVLLGVAAWGLLRMSPPSRVTSHQ